MLDSKREREREIEKKKQKKKASGNQVARLFFFFLTFLVNMYYSLNTFYLSINNKIYVNSEQLL